MINRHDAKCLPFRAIQNKIRIRTGFGYSGSHPGHHPARVVQPI